MNKIFVSPSCYVQGKGVLKTGIDYIKKLGEAPVLLCDEIVWKIVGEEFAENLAVAGLKVVRASFQGESSVEEIERVANFARENDCDVVLGLGGGKTIDVAKAIAERLELPVGILPTTASTDAPTSAISVIYSKTGTFEKYIFYNKNPELVLVDTKVISKAPARLLASGIADALATLIEVRAVSQSHGQTMVGGAATLAAQAIAEKCEETLFKYGLQAMEANRAKVVTEAFEAVVEANTLLSGIGFESGGLAAAHAIHNGFTALHGDIHGLTHGEKVAYGTLVQLVLENRPKEELDRYIRFYQRLELPTTLEQLKLGEATYEELLQIGKQTIIEGETIHQMPFIVTAEMIADAFLAVDFYVKSLK